MYWKWTAQHSLSLRSFCKIESNCSCFVWIRSFSSWSSRLCEQMKMWATVPPVGSSVSLNWLEPSEQKYPHACVFAAAWGNVLMPQLIRLTLTISAHLQRTDNYVASDVCFFFLSVCSGSFYVFGRPSAFFYQHGWALFSMLRSL